MELTQNNLQAREIVLFCLIQLRVSHAKHRYIFKQAPEVPCYNLCFAFPVIVNTFFEIQI